MLVFLLGTQVAVIHADNRLLMLFSLCCHSMPITAAPASHAGRTPGPVRDMRDFMCPTLFLSGKIGTALRFQDHSSLSILLFGRCNLCWRIPEIRLQRSQLVSATRRFGECRGLRWTQNVMGITANNPSTSTGGGLLCVIAESTEIGIVRITAFPGDIVLRQLSCRRSSLHQGRDFRRAYTRGRCRRPPDVLPSELWTAARSNDLTCSLLLSFP